MEPLTCLFCGDPIAKNGPFVHGGFTEKDSPLCLRCWTLEGEDLDVILRKATEIRGAVEGEMVAAATAEVA